MSDERAQNPTATSGLSGFQRSMNPDAPAFAAGAGNPTQTPAAWELLGSEYLFEHRHLKVRRDRVRLGSGRVMDDYFVLEYPAWVTVVALTREDDLVMVRQYRHGLSAVHLEIPGGAVDSGDSSPLHAARRELLEETGYGGGTWSPLLTSSANPTFLNNLSYAFLAVGVERFASPMLETSEELEIELLPAGQIWPRIQEGAIIQALHLAPLLAYLQSRR